MIKTKTRFAGIVLLLFCVFSVNSFAFGADAPAEAAGPAVSQPALKPEWASLRDRLAADGLSGQDIDGWFASLDKGYSEKPMGIMMGALFRIKYMPPPFSFLRKPVKTPEFLPDVFTSGNIRLCAEFMRAHPDILAGVTRDYKVEAEIVVALFMVETRLGNYMGHEEAFWSLACMSLADKPEKIHSYLDNLPTTAERLKWVSEQMDRRADWAYRELKALIEYCRLYGHDPLAITGSPFGAIGLPQFMPTNIPAYAADGDKDGVIDLFALEDALPSIARFLQEHGWKPGLGSKQQHQIIRRYNHSDAYANTVLALAAATLKYLENHPVKTQGDPAASSLPESGAE
ncbi:MAG: lytic murein transglycosylase [Deltaproteobacteria bacterium]|jgi:membrane-bound lytic murein transglycosylase B|nr:lytic murein transglycosylase [Deltaproteobacteria bacterium]